MHRSVMLLHGLQQLSSNILQHQQQHGHGHSMNNSLQEHIIDQDLLRNTEQGY
jgi:hypothetical protein